MAALADHVGLVSMAHTRGDLEKTRGLADAGVELYLWQSPALDATPPASEPSPLRRTHRLFHALVDAAKAWPHRPTDTIVLDGCFRNMASWLRVAYAKRSWDVLSVVESSASAMLDYLPRPAVTILVMHDVRSVLYERRARASRRTFERWRLQRQARRYYAFERERCQRYDLVTTVSREDADFVREHYGPRRVITVPLPVDAHYFAPRPDVTPVPGRIVFTGLMNHPPNADAAIYFAREVLPIVRDAVPEAEFYVVGRHPPREVQTLDRLAGVHVTGGVPDIRPYVAEATVIVVPLRYGSGARQKILEAWCMEKCVVSTTVGAEGLAYQDGVNISIADNASTMAAVGRAGAARARLSQRPASRRSSRGDARS